MEFDKQLNNVKVIDKQRLVLLQAQEYMAPIPKSLWLKMQVLLNGTERSIWQYIYAEYTKNVSKHDKERPVVISRKKLGMYISRGSTAVQNTLASLRDKGWLITEEQYSTKSGAQTACLFWPTIPESIKEEVLNAPKRKSHKKEINTHNKQEKVKISNTVYDQYLVKYNALICEGFSKAKAGQKALSEFSEDDKKIIHASLTATQDDAQDLSFKKPNEDRTPLENKRTYQQLSYQSFVNVNNNVSEKNSSSEKVNAQNKNSIPNPVDENKFRKIIEFKMHRLHKENKIPLHLLRDGKTLQDLIEELLFHVMHYNRDCVKSRYHALNGGIKLIVEGRWDTPLKMRCMRNLEAKQRELAWARQKETWIRTSSSVTAMLKSVVA